MKRQYIATVEFLINEDDIQEGYEAYLADGGENLDHPTQTAARVLAHDLQKICYDDGYMYGQFRVTRLVEAPINDEHESFAIAGPLGGGQPSAMKLLDEALRLMTAGNYKSSYETQIIEQMEKARDALVRDATRQSNRT
jgi:hypothetical protein